MKIVRAKKNVYFGGSFICLACNDGARDLCKTNEDMRQNSEAVMFVRLVEMQLTSAIVAHPGGCVCLHTTSVQTSITLTFALSGSLSSVPSLA